jgi:hypothetical protein
MKNLLATNINRKILDLLISCHNIVISKFLVCHVSITIFRRQYCYIVRLIIFIPEQVIVDPL